MNGLTTEEMVIAMKEISAKKKKSELNLSDVEKLRDYQKLQAEMADIEKQGGMVDMASDWLGGDL